VITVVNFKVLGPLEVLDGDRPCTPSPPKVRTVLALLLMCANSVVLVDSLIRELWGDAPLKSAVTTVQTYIYSLRKMIAKERLEPPGHKLLVSTACGYMLCVPEDRLDALVFQHLVYEGRAHLSAGRPEPGAKVLRQALDIWQGPVLANVTLGDRLHAHAIRLEEQRIRVLELRIQAEMELGLHRELVSELRYLVATNPLNEWFHRQLICSLSQCGRRSEALQAYQGLRRTLKEELGLDPLPDVQRLHHEVLAAGSQALRDPPAASPIRAADLLVTRPQTAEIRAADAMGSAQPTTEPGAARRYQSPRVMRASRPTLELWRGCSA
jgi:DNA-binding SARP family transcriptional activator